MNWFVFGAVLAIRVLCAQYSLIPDCDEVFNYWEPLHYLTHGFGLQTWEYSPEYAIRSWAYEALHVFPVKLFALASDRLEGQEQNLFFVLRYIFAVFSAAAETKLYGAIYRNVSEGPKIAQWYLLFSLMSTGMFHASIAFLPSSFAMHCLAIAMSYSLDRKIIKTMTWIAIGGLLGWPFALVLAVPFGLEYAFVQSSLASVQFWRTVGMTLVNVMLVLAVIVAIDSAAYQKLVVVPANIVLYNVLNASESAGPNIFGTEPWWFYPLNLAMNFNGIFVLSLLSVLVVVTGSASPRSRTAAVISPFFIWIGIFIIQPHKEERFMYVIYPSICLNAAFALEFLRKKIRLVPQVVVYLGLLAIAMVSLSRTMALVNYYHAPITVFSQLPDDPGNVCVGQEWYRFPSSYFLNQQQRLRFVKSGFDGLLPGEFDEMHWPSATHITPKGMNNQNIEDPGKYTNVDYCKYMVDMVSSDEEGANKYKGQFKSVYCTQFLSHSSSGIGRILYIPSVLHDVTRTNLVWDDYCLMERE